RTTRCPASVASLLQNFLGDDELHDLARALVDLGDLRVAVMALRWEVREVTVAAEDLHALAPGLHRDVAREELRFSRLEDEGLAAVLERRRLPGEQARGVDLRRHVRELPLDRLVLGDLLTERLALLRVRERVLEARPRDADSLCGDPDASAIECAQRDLEALADRADEIRIGNAALLEDELRGVRPADAELLLELPDTESLRALLDDKRGDAL